ncbi:Por secretion system C-terminal sorting domain-containing protein [Hymenobacter actinosclerus]|uniref:Por secretion system C-terminal sorting domain-containing protein n=2 Tax=Hymenobacter actinosclerus TaxID=82805 RepID=A0A1I0IIS9_9BACT|nr:Por secretion system C-terminal sorting domain-containing protein [Hymenobacter actinosclerus]
MPLQLRGQNYPDLVLVAPFSLPTIVTAGETYPMSASIRVNGSPGAGAQFNCIGYYLSSDARWDATDTYLGISCQGLLNAGQSGPTSIVATIPTLTTAGSYYIVLVADPLNAEQEQDETNNVVSFPVEVISGGVSLPDLELWRPSISFNRVPVGGVTGAFGFIFNRGASAVSVYEVGFYLSTDSLFSANTDIFIGQITGGSLNGTSNGSTGDGTFFSAPLLPVPRGTSPSNYYLLLVADPRNLIAESNENNNTRALPLTVTGNVLAAAAATPVEAVQLYPNPISQGANLTLRLEGATSKPVKLLLLDPLGRSIRQQILPPGQTETIIETAYLPSGLYLLHLTAENMHVVRRVQVK